MKLVIIAHNLRSIHNVGSILRTADGFGVEKVWLTGTTPSPKKGLPHEQEKLKKALEKTALGAEKTVANEYCENAKLVIENLKKSGYKIVGLEQDSRSVLLPNYKNTSEKIALLLGEEVAGILPELRDLCDDLIEIPMFGKKESFNVSVATGVAVYALLFSK